MSRSGVFGVWDAPATDGMVQIATPVGYFCRYCQEQITENDAGGAVWSSGTAEHRECALRMVMGGIGHLIDHGAFCGGEYGPDAGLSYRRSSLLVWAMVVDHEEITPERLLEEVLNG